MVSWSALDLTAADNAMCVFDKLQHSQQAIVTRGSEISRSAGLAGLL